MGAIESRELALPWQSLRDPSCSIYVLSCAFHRLPGKQSRKGSPPTEPQPISQPTPLSLWSGLEPEHHEVILDCCISSVFSATDLTCSEKLSHPGSPHGELGAWPPLSCLGDLRSTSLLSPLCHRAAPGSSLETGAVVYFPPHSNQEIWCRREGTFASRWQELSATGDKGTGPSHALQWVGRCVWGRHGITGHLQIGCSEFFKGAGEESCQPWRLICVRHGRSVGFWEPVTEV